MDVPVEIAWKLFRTGKDIEKWLPIFNSCKVTGEGAKRVCTI
jgi:hypothetical protein